MKITVNYDYKQEFLPTKRHKKARTRYLTDSTEIEIKEVTAEEFPIAFIVHSKESLYRDAVTFEDFRNDDLYEGYRSIVSDEIRTYNNKLYKAVRYSSGAAVSTLFENPYEILPGRLKNAHVKYRYYDNSDEFSEESVIIYDGKEDRLNELAEPYSENTSLIFDNKHWVEVDEPVYRVERCGWDSVYCTIDYINVDNVSEHERYFNAMQKDKALERAMKIARRFEKEDKEYFNDYNIEVVMPEMVKIHRQPMNYTQFKTVNLGYSSYCHFILAGIGDNGLNLCDMQFSFSGGQSAYLVTENEVEIGEEFEKIAEFKQWLKIYDDTSMKHEYEAENIIVYQAGEECIIHLVNAA